MIKDTYVIFNKENSFITNKTEIEETTVAFVNQKGKEKMYIAGSTFDFVPGGGSPGQILKKGTDNLYWDAPNKLYVGQTGLANLRNEYTIFIAKLTATENEMKLISPLEKGETITVYAQNTSENSIKILINDSFVSLNGETEFTISANQWVIIKILSDGNNYYVEIYKPDDIKPLVEFFKYGQNDNSIVVNNNTLTTKNPDEFIIGRYNKSIRETQSKWGVNNSLFTVGNGLDKDNIHDAFMVCQNGTVYISDTSGDGEYYEKPMISLQEALMNGGGDFKDIKYTELFSIENYSNSESSGNANAILRNVTLSEPLSENNYYRVDIGDKIYICLKHKDFNYLLDISPDYFMQ